MSCLKWLFSPRQVEPVQKTNKNAEEKEGLIKKKGSSIATKSGVIKKYPWKWNHRNKEKERKVNILFI